LQIGVDPEEIDLGTSAALHAYGVKRGDFAHKFKITTKETRSSITNETKQIFDGLQNFDVAACVQLHEGMKE